MPESAPAPLPVQGQSTGPVRYQSFDGLDEITRTTRPRGWLALAAIAVLVAAFTPGPALPQCLARSAAMASSLSHGW